MFVSVVSISRPRLSAAARAFIARMTAKPDPAQRFRLGTVFRRLAAVLPVIAAGGGIWLAQADAQSSSQNLAGAANTLVMNGGVTYSPYVGWTGDGATGWVSTGIVPATAPGASLNECALGVLVLDDQKSDATTIGASGGGGVLGLRAWSTSNNFISWANSSGAATVKAATSAGFSMASRGAATGYVPASEYLAYKNKAGTRISAAAIGLPTNALNLLRVSNGGTYASNTVHCFFYSVIGLSLAQLQLIDDTMTAYGRAVGAISTEGEAPAPELGPNYMSFTGADRSMDGITRPRLVIMQARAPLSDTEPNISPTGGYPYYPLNVAAIGDLSTCVASTWTKGKVYEFSWVPRGVAALPLNPYPNILTPPIRSAAGLECRIAYPDSDPVTSRAKATAAGIIRKMWSTGYLQSECQRVASDHGLTLLPLAQLKAEAATRFTGYFDYLTRHYRVANDIAWLPTVRLVDLQPQLRGGIMDDYEVQDGRSPDESLAAINWSADVVQQAGYQYALYANALDGPGAFNSGLGATNLPAILAKANLTSILVFSGTGDLAASIATQFGMYGEGADPDKIALTVGLGGLSLDQAHAARDAIEDYGFGGLNNWRFNQQQGGAFDQGANPVLRILTGLP